MNFYSSICENKDFHRIYSRGKSFVSPVLVSYAMKSRRNSNSIRVGITTSKKIGNAVKRNRARRIIREAFLSLEKVVKPGYDFIFVARARTPFVKSTDVRRDMLRQLKNAGALK